MNFRQAILRTGHKSHSLVPGRPNSFEEVFADFQVQTEADATRYSIFLHPKQDIVVERLEVQFSLQLPQNTRFFANGYQSASESRLLDLNDGIPGAARFARKRLGFTGDEHIPGIPRGNGYLHAWTYTYFTAHPKILFAGSLNERSGFTLFLYDLPNSILTVRKDMDGMMLGHSFPALDFWIAEGPEIEIFDRYFRAMEVPAVRPGLAAGWQSQDRYPDNLTEDVLLENLESFPAMATAAAPAAYFRIGDGWQTNTGDWRSVKPAFPKGMGWLAAQIRAKGLHPGLWMAPFVASATSDLARRNPDWLLKNRNGKTLKAGWNAAWGGWYYALDFYNPQVRDYLSGIFHVALDNWGFDLLHLDFLFAVCLSPPAGKNRGQVMYEAMEFLREQTGKRVLLAGRVPLGSAFGLADFCRVNGDIHAGWENRLPALLRHRERISTVTALRSALGRWQLNGRAFRSDTGAFTLQAAHRKLTPDQQYTSLVINILLGNKTATSDRQDRYTPEQMTELAEAADWRGAEAVSVNEPQTDLFEIKFRISSASYSAYCNLRKQARQVSLRSGNFLELRAFETIVLAND